MLDFFLGVAVCGEFVMEGLKKPHQINLSVVVVVIVGQRKRSVLD